MRTNILPWIATGFLVFSVGCDQSNETNRQTATVETPAPKSTPPPQHVPKANGITFIQWDTAIGGNGHYYGITDSTMSWTAAEDFARTLGGHLVAINSVAEQAFIETTLLTGANEKTIAWIGLNDAASEGSYVWTTGEPVSFFNWAPGEPNDNQNVFDEDYVAINYYYNQNGATKGKWIDAPDNGVPNAGTATGPYRGLIEAPEAPATSTTANPPISAPELAPEGVFFLVRRISAKTESGVFGVPPGTMVKMIEEKGATALVAMSDGGQFEVSRSFLTNDLNMARLAGAQDAKAQAIANANAQKQIGLAAKMELEKRKEGDRQREETLANLRGRPPVVADSGPVAPGQQEAEYSKWLAETKAREQEDLVRLQKNVMEREAVSRNSNDAISARRELLEFMRKMHH